MLMFNFNTALKTTSETAYLNTSHVNVQPPEDMQSCQLIFHLNTSHVNVQL